MLVYYIYIIYEIIKHTLNNLTNFFLDTNKYLYRLD